MGDLDHKDKKKADQADRKRRADVDDQEGSGDATMLPWDADVEHFMNELELKLNGLRTAMTSNDFRAMVGMYRGLSVAERRSVANRLQRRRMSHLLRALHAGDFRLYTDHWETDAKLAREADTRAPEVG